MLCPSLIDLEYGVFSERLHEKVSQKRIPLNGSMEVTMRCNLRCEHCYLPFAQRSSSQKEELSLAEFQRIFDEIAEAGCLWLLFTGGEPFLRKDFLRIYNEAKQRGFIISVFTNGTLINEKIADYLAEWRPFAIEVSLYGATQATYERVTGIPGSYTRCMHGIELLLERSLPLQLKSVLITLNQDELVQMQQISESLGLEFRFDPVINAAIDGDTYPTQFRLAPEQIIAIETHDPERSKKWPKIYEELKNIEITTNQMYTCGAGRSGFHIDAYGKICLCLTARTPSYDLRKGNFQQGWRWLADHALAQHYSQAFECSACQLRKACAQCPAMGLSEMGNAEARVPFICQLAHLRYEAFHAPENY